jgi:MFS transporter
MTTIQSTNTVEPRTLPPVAARPGLILLFLCIVQSIVYIDVTIVNVALPSIQRSLDMPGRDLQFIVTAYGTMLGGFLLLGGRLADTFGRRRLLLTGLVLFGLASLAAGLSQDQGTLIGARVVQGLGAALIAPAALSTLTTTFAEGAARSKALGIWGARTFHHHPRKRASHDADTCASRIVSRLVGDPGVGLPILGKLCPGGWVHGRLLDTVKRCP